MLDDFYVDYQVSKLRASEFIETIRVPLPGEGVVLRSHKLSKRFDQDISAVCSAYRLELDDNRVKSFRIACGGLATTVKRASNCEAAVNGKRWDEKTINAGILALAEDFTPISDMRASADYRLRATQNLLRRFFLETRGELPATVYNYGRRD